MRQPRTKMTHRQGDWFFASGGGYDVQLFSLFAITSGLPENHHRTILETDLQIKEFQTDLIVHPYDSGFRLRHHDPAIVIVIMQGTKK